MPISKYYKTNKEVDLYSLDILEAFPPDEGVYKVTAVNQEGKAECTCKLTVSPSKDTPDKDRPSFIKKPYNAYYHEGASFKIDATVQGAKPITVTW